MLNSIKIKNFRCFDEIEVEGFKRVNFIVGQNATGKTALLEGINICLEGNIIAFENLGIIRQNVNFKDYPNNLEYLSYWSHFFKNEKIQNIISMEADLDGKKINLKAYFDNKIEYSKNQNKPFAYSAFSVEVNKNISQYLVENKGIIATNLTTPKILNFYGHTNFGIPPSEASQVFSMLSRINSEEKVTENLRKLFPQVKALSVSTSPIETIVAEVEGIDVKIPISQISAGVLKATNILLTMMSFKNGIVLIDEIENGLHVSILEKFWQVLYDLAVENNVQLFITSHSLECMNAAEKTVEKHPDDFALFKMVDENGRIQAKQFSGKILRNVLESDYDFR